MVHLMGRMGTEPILSIKWSVSIDATINFDGDGDKDGDGTCKQAFRQTPPPRMQTREIHAIRSTSRWYASY